MHVLVGFGFASISGPIEVVVACPLGGIIQTIGFIEVVDEEAAEVGFARNNLLTR